MKRAIQRMLILLLCVAVLAGVVPAADVAYAADIFSEGDGSAQSPFIISTEQQLYDLATATPFSDFSDKHFRLDADLDLSSYNVGGGWPCIGGYVAFTGVFDGNGHTISHLSYNGTSGQYGLFGLIEGGTVKNLHLVDVTINASKSVIGGICGKITGLGAKIEGCSVSGTITGLYQTGGIAGSVEEGAVVENCWNTADIASTDSTESSCAGGIAGLIYDSGAVKSCFNTGNVSGARSDVGGIVGYMHDGTVSDCYNTGDIKGTWNIGGIAGIALEESSDNNIFYCPSGGLGKRFL